MADSVQTLKGFRDFAFDDMETRRQVMSVLSQVFERFGFRELATPAIEYQSVLLGKYGKEAEKLMYLFQDPGGRDVGLKYDLTVPLARYMATTPNLVTPFKRYQMQPVWRAENTQRGRYREFYQCDVDIVGSHSPLADAEIIAVIDAVMKALKFDNYHIRVNSRTVLFSLMEKAKISNEMWLTTIQSLDKLDKKTKEEVEAELWKKGLTSDEVSTLFELLPKAAPDSTLTAVMDAAATMGVTSIDFDPALSRGLDYYTGPIFETVVESPKIGSLTGGGRYDKLMATIGGPDLPAVGTTIGFERIVDVLTETNRNNKIIRNSALVTVFNEEMTKPSIEAVALLRAAGINSEIYFEDTKLAKQFKYADRNKIPWVIVIGPEEAQKQQVVLKDMTMGQESLITMSEAINQINSASK